MDIDSVRQGSLVIVPVKVDGAGIYADDIHAMIGDGEVAVHTTDIGARLVVRVEVIKGHALDGPILLPPADDLPFLAQPFTATRSPGRRRSQRRTGPDSRGRSCRSRSSVPGRSSTPSSTTARPGPRSSWT